MRVSNILVLLGMAGMIGAGITGCQKKDDAQSATRLTLQPGICQTNDVTRSYLELPPDGVLVQVGSRILTRTAFQEGVDEYLLLYKRVGPRSNEQDDKRIELAAFNYVFANFMARAAMLEEAQARGTVPEETDLADAERFIGQICKRLKLKRADFAARFSGGEKTVTRRIQEEATLKALIRAEFGKDAFQISDAEAQEVKERLERRAKVSSATNEIFRAELGQVRTQGVSGKLDLSQPGDIIQAALPGSVTYDGVITNSAMMILFEQTADALKALKPGEWSPVIEVEEYYELYRLQAVTSNKDDKELTTYAYAKFSAPRDLGWEIPSIGQLKRDLSNRRRKEQQGAWVRGLMVKYGVLYPNGIHLFKMNDAEGGDRPKRQRNGMFGKGGVL